MRSGEISKDQTVLVKGARIAYAGPPASAPSLRGARVVDGSGKFLIPGLWDMHVHGFLYVFSDFAGPLMIANGVTGARDMGYYIDTTLRWKRDIAAGKVIGPRLVVGVRIDGDVNKARFVSHVKTAEDGVRAVDTLARKKDGTSRADFIAVEKGIPREAYFAIARESKRLGISLAGFVPSSVSVVEAADSGQRTFEREDDVVRACTPHTSPTCRATIAALAANHAWVTPTLVSYQPFAHAFDSASTHPELAKYVPGIVKGGWVRRTQAAPKSDSMIVRGFFSFDRTRELRDAGVKLLAGSDMPQTFMYPGFSLHDELGLLVQAGLTPLEALQTATMNPAEALGMQGALGTIGQGKVADMILLDANPLENIANTRRISAVIANGRLFDRAALNQLLHHVDSALKR
ncbi:MAG TPA: amidohydrolase family protein [Gemmatimonadaceae bacterium]|nr:amidohydrolase family protein [Gemmatimonadaceae bacterium]